MKDMNLQIQVGSTAYQNQNKIYTQKHFGETTNIKRVS